MGIQVQKSKVCRDCSNCEDYQDNSRYLYVPEDENSCKSVEIERVMRESRLRELVKGVYSSSYGDSVANKVN